MPLTDEQRERLREDLALEELQKRQAGRAFVADVRKALQDQRALPPEEREPTVVVEWSAPEPRPVPIEPENLAGPRARLKPGPKPGTHRASLELIILSCEQWMETHSYQEPSQDTLAANIIGLQTLTSGTLGRTLHSYGKSMADVIAEVYARRLKRQKQRPRYRPA